MSGCRAKHRPQTAKEIGLDTPANFVLRADKLIE
jgi:hypothetical protein